MYVSVIGLYKEIIAVLLHHHIFYFSVFYLFLFSLFLIFYSSLPHPLLLILFLIYSLFPYFPHPLLYILVLLHFLLYYLHPFILLYLLPFIPSFSTPFHSLSFWFNTLRIYLMYSVFFLSLFHYFLSVFHFFSLSLFGVLRTAKTDSGINTLQDGDVIYCRDLRAFGIRPVLEYEPAPCGKCTCWN